MALLGVAGAIKIGTQEVAFADTSQRWVELPDCGSKGADNSVPLRYNVQNAQIATCKGKFREGMYDPADQVGKPHRLHPDGANQTYYPIYTTN